ncbi:MULTISPECIES: dipeptide/oligopeptide/nickel ABC transporter permease/ATP-binding protein [unclassified Streptomyces]|uniref:dipeptide/oligopeptide/nickel ABC transporter permease/ATP-binding protein n=1 Tax=unclassified Streptomyces TaxID=2593676 RepID=UPI0006F67C03|nr:MULTISPECIES: dipeptide/oligopeptide/nickel ABC transporter permease/ATP-binding protein [unclassified Streptomyces]KQX56948.1 peptide ABC transporter ATP-binding protein [Streptomyces sp. Root1304]KRA98529.1 peptide ABC transporter ATP-binding protein [Streptomyces sp. Root66D1]
MRRARWNAPLVVALTGLGLIALLGIVAPFLWEERATALGGSARAHPSGAHWLGTDALGRDVLARTLVATRLTLEMTLAATALAAVAGSLLGTVVWVSGRRVRELGLRLIDVMISYPALILALVIATVLGTGPTASLLAIGLGGAPAFARLTANMAASVAQRDFVTQARLMGVPPFRLLARHLLPNISGPLLVLVSVAFANVLVALSGLSFLGVGVQSPDYDWGALLNSGLESLYTNPAEAIGPAVAITVTGVLAGFVGDGLATALDPRAGGTTARARPAVEVAARSHRTPADALVTVDNLVVALPDGTRLVDDVSFHVMPGEILGLVGESGSGKSLTAMSVARILPEGLSAHAAELTLDDLDLTGSEADPRRLATEIGIVFQDPSASFNPALKVGGQLTETLRVHQGVRGGKARGRAVEALEQVRIENPARVVKQYPHELSGGMRQRAMIAAAILPGPRLIVADEPTTALDVTVQAEVLDLLKDINSTRGTSMLFISHDIGVIGTVCHRIVVMYAGRVVEELSAADLRAGRARHPYTKALLAASPRLQGMDADTDTVVERAPLATIPGRPPAPADRPAGCAFADRCPVVLDGLCGTERPPMADAVACHAVRQEVQPA